MNTISRYWFKVLGIILFTLVLSCSRVGPDSIPRDQFNYNAAIAESSNEQLLLNLIRLRYSEPLVFLRVSSVISQYSRSGSVSATGEYNPNLGSYASSGIGGTWAHTPTITYSPVSGSEFSQNLLYPLPADALFRLVQSGWPSELVLRITTSSINGIHNDVARPSRRRSADERLTELLEVWRKLSTAGLIGIKTQPSPASGRVVLFIRSNVPEEYKVDVEKFCNLMNLDPTLDEYEIRYGLIQQKNSEIVVLTGSIWDVMINLAWQFNVPQEHIDSGRTLNSFEVTDERFFRPIDLKFSKNEPKDAFIAVFEHGYWFYIEHTDRESKRVFAFLQLLLSLAESTRTDVTPAITIPSN
jgi:hypothetical protein